MVIPNRTNMLIKNQSAGNFDSTAFFVVHQRPPKKNTPKRNPANSENIIMPVSFIVIPAIVMNFFIFS